MNGDSCHGLLPDQFTLALDAPAAARQIAIGADDAVAAASKPSPMTSTIASLKWRSTDTSEKVARNSGSRGAAFSTPNDMGCCQPHQSARHRCLRQRGVL